MSNRNILKSIGSVTIITFSLCFISVGIAAAQNANEEPLSPETIRLRQAVANPPDFIKDDPIPVYCNHGNDFGGGVNYLGARIDALLGYPFGLALMRGRWLVRQENFAEACTEFETAAKLKPDYFPYEEWSDALERAGHIEAAASVYRKAIGVVEIEGKQKSTTSSLSPAVWMQYALFLVRQKNYSEALITYDKGRQAFFSQAGKGEAFRLAMTADNFDKASFEAAAHTILGKNLLTFRNYVDYACPEDVRIREYQAALVLKPNYLPAILYLAEAYTHHYNSQWKATVPDLLAQALQSPFPEITIRAKQIQDDLARQKILDRQAR